MGSDLGLNQESDSRKREFRKKNEIMLMDVDNVGESKGVAELSQAYWTGSRPRTEGQRDQYTDEESSGTSDIRAMRKTPEGLSGDKVGPQTTAWLVPLVVLALCMFVSVCSVSGSQEMRLDVPLLYPEGIGRSVKLTLHCPGSNQVLMKTHGEDAYWLQITIPQPVVKPFPKRKTTGEEGKGVFLSVEDPGSVMLAVEDAKAHFGKSASGFDEALYFKQTEGRSNDAKEYSGIHKIFGEAYDLKPPTIDEDFKAQLDFLIGLTPVGLIYSSLELIDKLILANHEFDWGLTTMKPAKTDETLATTGGAYEKGGGASKPQLELTLEYDSDYDFQSVSWARLCSVFSASGKDQGLEVNYCFNMVRDRSDPTKLWIRVVIPYRYLEGTEQSLAFGQIEQRRDAEIEWQITLPRQTGPTESTEKEPAGRYEVITSCKTWEQARKDCEARGGHLVTIESEEENETVVKLLRDSGYGNSWIGLRREFTTWKWVTFANMKDLSYRNWAYAEPFGSDDYAEIQRDGMWYGHEDPYLQRFYLCEYEPSLPPKAKAKLTFASAFDDGDEDVSKYRLHIELNGHLIYSGCPGVGTFQIEHGRWGKEPDSGFQNLKDLEILFDRELLQEGDNYLHVTLSGVDPKRTFVWESLTVDGIEVPYQHRARIHDTTYQSFVHGEETYDTLFTFQ